MIGNRDAPTLPTRRSVTPYSSRASTWTKYLRTLTPSSLAVGSVASAPRLSWQSLERGFLFWSSMTKPEGVVILSLTRFDQLPIGVTLQIILEKIINANSKYLVTILSDKSLNLCNIVLRFFAQKFSFYLNNGKQFDVYWSEILLLLQLSKF